MKRCACCRRGATKEFDEVPLCEVCARSWLASAARVVAVREKMKDFGLAIWQFITGKSCYHFVGKQRPSKPMEQLP